MQHIKRNPAVALLAVALVTVLALPVLADGPVDVAPHVKVGSGGHDITHATASVSSASATEVVAAVSDKQIVIVGFKISASAACNIKWVENTSSASDLSSVTYLAANGGWTGGLAEGRPVQLWATTAGNNLGVTSSTADAVAIDVWYITK